MRSAAREFESVQAALSTTGAPAQYTDGTPYVLLAVSVTAALPATSARRVRSPRR